MVIRFYGGMRVNLPPYTKEEQFEFYQRMAGRRPDGSQGHMVIVHSGPRGRAKRWSCRRCHQSDSSGDKTRPRRAAAAEASPADQPKGKARRRLRS